MSYPVMINHKYTNFKNYFSKNSSHYLLFCNWNLNTFNLSFNIFLILNCLHRIEQKLGFKLDWSQQWYSFFKLIMFL